MLSLFWPFKLAVWIIKALFSLLVFASGVLTLAACFADKGWLWSLASHFRLQYLEIQLVALFFLIGGLLFRCPKEANFFSWVGTGEKVVNIVAILAMMFLNVEVIAPYYLSHNPTPPNNAPHLTVMSLNLLGRFNHNFSDVLALVQDRRPDLIAFSEYTDQWGQTLANQGMGLKYPYQFIHHDYGLALYSTRPLQQSAVMFLHGDPGRRSSSF